MPFVQLQSIHTRTSRGATVPLIRMGSQLANNKHPRMIAISVSRMAFTSVGFTTFASEGNTRCRMRVDEGWGDDAGFWLFTPLPHDTGEKSYACGGARGNFHTLQIAIAMGSVAHYVLNEKPIDMHDVEFSTEGKSLLVQCPDWLRYNPQSLTNEQLALIKVPNYVPPPDDEAAKVTVTAPSDLKLNRQDRRKLSSGIAKALTR